MLVEYSMAVFSEWKDRVLRIARDAAAVLGDGDGAGYLPVQPLGIMARPLDPETDANGNAKRGAGLLTFEDGHEGFAMPTTEPRALEFIPELPKGSTVVYACNGTLIYLDGQTGTLMIMARYRENNADKSHAISLDGGGNGRAIQIRHGDGMGICIANGGANSVVINNKAGDAYVEVRDGGININGTELLVNAGQVVGDIPQAKSVLIADEEFIAWKAAIDAVVAALVGAAGSVVPPGLVATAPLPVTGSQVLKASKAPPPPAP